MPGSSIGNARTNASPNIDVNSCHDWQPVQPSDAQLSRLQQANISNRLQGREAQGHAPVCWELTRFWCHVSSIEPLCTRTIIWIVYRLQVQCRACKHQPNIGMRHYAAFQAAHVSHWQHIQHAPPTKRQRPCAAPDSSSNNPRRLPQRSRWSSPPLSPKVLSLLRHF
jgi:hypothetical protein